MKINWMTKNEQIRAELARLHQERTKAFAKQYAPLIEALRASQPNGTGAAYKAWHATVMAIAERIESGYLLASLVFKY